jgi:hypothetical protein
MAGPASTVMARLTFLATARPTFPVMARSHFPVMAGLDPAIYRGTVLNEMAGSSPAMTNKQRRAGKNP